ncbi:hypothetical protein J1614_011107 [Plenodomus biglobosus]|nr:hypothetical protein J1614_011107 [Plenodomus biglobosus]
MCRITLGAVDSWELQQNCPDIKIPDLLGFGFSDGRRFTHMAQSSSLCTGLTLTSPLSALLSAFPFHRDTSTTQVRIL